MVKLLHCLAALGLALAGMAQDPGPRQGLLLGSAAISPGFMLRHDITNIHLTGRLEYYLEQRISLRGRGTWYVDAQQQFPLLDRSAQLSLGPCFHFGRDRLDLHLGFDPGLALVQPAAPMIGLYELPLRAVPTIGLGTGLTWFVWDHFHFFAEARYQHARYEGHLGGPLSLAEVILSGGLGFHLRPVR